MADDLSAQGSGLRARQTKRRPHAPEEHTPTPGANLRVDINFLAKGREEEAGLSVGKEVQQPRQFTVDASGRGDDRRQEGVTQTVSLVTRESLASIHRCFYKLAQRSLSNTLDRHQHASVAESSGLVGPRPRL